MSTITSEQEQAIAEYIKDRNLAWGRGTRESPCSIAAINLALYDKLTDQIPDCMSEYIGWWIVNFQDLMPYVNRNPQEWKRLLPLAAGTGRAKDKEALRFNIIEEWIFDCLALLQPHADEEGFGDLWRDMIKLRTEEAFEAVRIASYLRPLPETILTTRFKMFHAVLYASPIVDKHKPYQKLELGYGSSISYISSVVGWDAIKMCAVLERLVAV